MSPLYMASTNRSTSEQDSSGSRDNWDRFAGLADPIWGPLAMAIEFVTSSFFRFMLILGLAFLLLGALLSEGVMAGHLLVYGVTAIFLGVLGRAITYWKLKDAT